MQPLGVAIRAVCAADVGSFIPVDSQPSQIVEHRRFRFACGSLDIGVLDAQDERPARTASEQPVEHGRTHIADVQRAGRTWSETNSHVYVAQTVRVCRALASLKACTTHVQSQTTNKRDRMDGEGFAAADLADAFVGLPLDAYTI